MTEFTKSIKNNPKTRRYKIVDKYSNESNRTQSQIGHNALVRRKNHDGAT